MDIRRTVLLADANEEFRTLVRKIIDETEEFSVVGSVGDGTEALRLAREEAPDLILMDVVLPGAAAKGYTTDNCVTPDGLPAGRPQPFMIYKNMTDLNVPSVTSVVKYGDTIADIKEGVNAGVWTVGVILGSNEMGLTQEETEKLPSDELNKRMAAVRKRMYMAGAHYVVNSIAELPEIIEIINHKIN